MSRPRADDFVRMIHLLKTCWRSFWWICKRMTSRHQQYTSHVRHATDASLNRRLKCTAASYTVTETPKGFARNVFTLNKKRMPDFSGFCKKAHELGMRVVPNIKPYLNVWHPAFASLEEQNGLFHDPDTSAAVRTYIWSMGIGEKLQGGWIDTSSQAGFQWWYDGVCKLIEMGVDGLWK